MIDGSKKPDDELAKEVYAHFGLCMYMSQVFETGLINILTALETAKSSKPSPEIFDHLYEKHERLTFGNLIKSLRGHNFVPADLLDEAELLKRERDFLAHRFFRDHVLDMATTAGSHVMIDALINRRDRFKELDIKIEQFVYPAFERLGISGKAIDRDSKVIASEMEKEAQAKYSSRLKGR